jgi:hypothetical protein
LCSRDRAASAQRGHFEDELDFDEVVPGFRTESLAILSLVSTESQLNLPMMKTGWWMDVIEIFGHWPFADRTKPWSLDATSVHFWNDCRDDG